MIIKVFLYDIDFMGMFINTIPIYLNFIEDMCVSSNC